MAQSSTNAALSPWKVVSLDSFHTPERTQASQWRRSFRAATTWMVGREASERQAKQESELRALPEVKLAHWAPSIDWTPAARGLAQSLQAYDEAPMVMFVSPPHGGHAAVVRHWAAQRSVECLTPPTLPELLEGSTVWLDHVAPRKRWAIPALERHFLRHTNGLQGVRELVERSLSGRMGQSVIGCDSWTYAYLQHAVGLEGVPVLTLQGLEGEQLAHYFAHHVDRTVQVCPTVYSTRTGRPVLMSESDDKAVYSELQRLTAHCRGHLGIAWHYWRERLREPSEENASDDGQETRSDMQELWLLDALADAELPADTGEVATLLLHTLLIHGGLDDQALRYVLPFSDHEALNARFSLAQRGILSGQEGRWQVAPLCYASVRQLLASRNYLVDPL
ncbi:hypothetical protein [Vreelandella piezotolerans]|uniref:Uncharacterized protein n=1 Tax=Vreelandella piezotolerans TaxID=2609667 RepID=A0ABQ6XC17_9GAMM|nr:hypothetical protein [Halomonas piezotolerans]KAE8439568.1 hypothetical protein F1978_04935 [Halomonas piezotolerans]QJA24913.1 hypothetical protein GYM47_12820 [Halomonas piezotolerans]